MSKSYTVMELEAIKYLCKCVNSVASLPADLIADTNVATNTTYSSYKIDAEMSALENDIQRYVDTTLAKLNKLSKEIIYDKTLVVKENVLYLYKDPTDMNNDYMQMMLINGTVVELGSTTCNMSGYYTNTEVDDKFALKIDKDKIVTVLDDTVTDEQVASAKAVKEALDNASTDNSTHKTDITSTIDSSSTDTQIPSAKAVYELNLRGTSIDQSVINKYGTEILKYPLGRWCIDGNEIAGKFSDIPWATACIIDITSIIINEKNPWDNQWSYRNYKVQTIENKGNFVRQLESRGTPGVLVDTGWQKVCTTTVDDVSKTLTPLFPSVVKVASGGVAIYYVVKNGWCNVNFKFNITSSTTFSWTDIAWGLPIPANSIDAVLRSDGKATQPIPIKITSTGSVSSKVLSAISTTDWWTGNISYPVAE